MFVAEWEARQLILLHGGRESRLVYIIVPIISIKPTPCYAVFLLALKRYSWFIITYLSAWKNTNSMQVSAEVINFKSIHAQCRSPNMYTVEPPITDPPTSGQPLLTDKQETTPIFRAGI